MHTSHGLRVVLVAAAAVALLHGLLLRTLHPEEFGAAPAAARAGRPHDGRPHEPLGAQFLRTREDDLREMFEFASAPSDWRKCASPEPLDLSHAPDMQREQCASGRDRSAYVPAAVINRYTNEAVMNGGLMEGVGAFESAGFGGSALAGDLIQ